MNTNHSEIVNSLHINETIALLGWQERGDQAAARWLQGFYRDNVMDACAKWVSQFEEIEYLAQHASARLVMYLGDWNNSLPIDQLIARTAREAYFECIDLIKQDYEVLDIAA